MPLEISSQTIEPLRLLHILDHSLPLQSGYASRSQAIALAQKRRGWEPLSVTSPKHYESWRGPWVDMEQVGGVKYFRTRGPVVGKYLFEAELRLMATLGARLTALCRQEHPALLHAHSPILNALPALFVGKRMRIPVVYEMRSLWEDAAVNHETYGRHSLKYRLVRLLETFVCRQADYVAVLCNGLGDDLVKRGIPRERMTAIPNGVDPQTFHVREPDREIYARWYLSGKKVIGFIGSFFRYEGLDLLIDAVARLHRTRSDIVLVLIGDGLARQELSEQVKRLGIERIVIMPGVVPLDQVPGLYALMDVLVYPRHSMRLTELVTPLKPLEAMAMGKALIASNVGGHCEMIRDGVTGLLFPADNVDALVTTLNGLLDDEVLRQTLGRQGARWVSEERSWDKTTSGYIDIYSRVLRRPIGQ